MSTDGALKLGPTQKPGRSKQDYGTPADFLEAVERRFGEIVVDLAATDQNTVAPQYYTPRQDSLAQDWAGDMRDGVLWLNPPFGGVGPWASKCREESAKRRGLILLLVPASIGSAWFRDHVHRHAMVFALAPRLKFVGTEAPYPGDLILAVYGMGLSGFDTWVWR